MEAAGTTESPAAPSPDPTGQAGRAALTDCLILRAGDALWTVPAADILCIAESADAPAPLPHPPAAVEGLVAIEGRAFVQVDPAAALGAPIRGPRPGGALVVVALGAGGVALRVDAVTPGTTAPRLALDDLIPWARGGAQPREAVPRAAAPRRAVPVPLLLVASGATRVALSVNRIERVGKVDATQALRGDGSLALVRVEDALLPARRLADTLPATAGTADADGGWAVVLRGDDDAAAALTVDRVLGLEPCDAERIATVTLPTGETQRWLNRAGAEPIQVLDAGGLFGWPSPPVSPGSSHRRTAAPVPGGAAFVTAQAGDLRVALPLDIMERVLEPGLQPSARRTPGAIPAFDAAVALGRRSRPRTGTFVRVRLDGSRVVLLSFDRVLALAEPASPWQAVEPLPPAAGAMVDAVCRDQTGTHWLFRLRHAFPALPPPRALLRCLAAARLGWATPNT